MTIYRNEKRKEKKYSDICRPEKFFYINFLLSHLKYEHTEISNEFQTQNT